MTIVEASIAEAHQIAPLFDEYRMFYGKQSDIAKALSFITERLTNKDSKIFLARDDKHNIIGFTQLYYTFSSVSCMKDLILNDLFVLPQWRGRGVGKALLVEAQKYVSCEGSKGLALETGCNNPARKLYEKMGWKNDSEVIHYYWLA